MLQGVVIEDLDAIASEMEAMAGRVRSLSQREPVRGVRISTLTQIHTRAKELAAAARREYDLRRMREAYVASPHFGEPAWDIMLDVFSNTLLGKSVSVSSACVASHAPPTTGLRYIEHLIQDGVLIRTDDPEDGRRRLLTMSDEAVASVGSFFMATSGYTGVSANSTE